MEVCYDLDGWHFQALILRHVRELFRQAEVCEAIVPVMERHDIEGVRRVASLVFRSGRKGSEDLRLGAFFVMAEGHCYVAFVQFLNYLEVGCCFTARRDGHDFEG